MEPHLALREVRLPKSTETTKSVGGYGRKSEFADLASANVLDARRMFYFFHVVRTGSFTAAEATLDIAQSTLSRQIQQLEEDVGEQLLLRTGRGVALTHAGEIVYRQAEAILREMAVAREQLAAARQSARGSISIAASRPFTTRFLPEIIDRFIVLFPDVHLTVHEASSGHVYQYLADGVVDFAVVLHSPNSQKITTKKLLNEQLNLVVRSDHPLAATKSVSRKSLGSIDLMLPAAPHGTRSILEKYFEAGDLVIDPTLRLDSVSLMKEVIAQGKYGAILPSMACEAQLLDGSFVAVPPEPAHLTDALSGEPEGPTKDADLRGHGARHHRNGRRERGECHGRRRSLKSNARLRPGAGEHVAAVPRPEAPFDPAALVPIGRSVSRITMAILVPRSSPASTLQEFVSCTKSKKGALSFWSSSAGNITHLGMETFMARVGIEMVHVRTRARGVC